MAAELYGAHCGMLGLLNQVREQYQATTRVVDKADEAESEQREDVSESKVEAAHDEQMMQAE